MKRPKKSEHLVAVALCLTLGLAPFFPEPHLFGKIRWILGGAEGMAAMDWFDFAMHGAPFVYLSSLLGREGAFALRASRNKTTEKG